MSEDTALLHGVSYDSRPGRLEDADRQAAQDRLAAWLVRKQAMRHNPQCRHSCRHRNCGRDSRHLTLLLETLDLADESPRPEDYGTRLLWHAVSRQDAQIMAWRTAGPEKVA